MLDLLFIIFGPFSQIIDADRLILYSIQLLNHHRLHISQPIVMELLFSINANLNNSKTTNLKFFTLILEHFHEKYPRESLSFENQKFVKLKNIYIRYVLRKIAKIF